MNGIGSRDLKIVPKIFCLTLFFTQQFLFRRLKEKRRGFPRRLDR
jgi:hypothetical protein